MALGSQGAFKEVSIRAFWFVLVAGPLAFCTGAQQDKLETVRALRARRPWEATSKGPVVARGEVKSQGLVRTPLGRECAAWRGEITVRSTRRTTKGKQETTYHSECTAHGSAPLAVLSGGVEAPLVGLDLRESNLRWAEKPLSHLPEPPCTVSGVWGNSYYTETCLLPEDMALASGCASDGSLGPCAPSEGPDPIAGLSSPPPVKDPIQESRGAFAWEAVAGAVYLAFFGSTLLLLLYRAENPPRRARR